MDEVSRIQTKLGEIRQYLNEIETRLPGSLDDYLTSDLTLRRTFERDLQLISECQFEILSILTRLKDIGIASSENGLIDKFRKILSFKTIENIRELRRMRNTLTHTYANERYDESVFVSALSLKKVRLFIEEAENLIKPTGKT